jgi:hypothetical protein
MAGLETRPIHVPPRLSGVVDARVKPGMTTESVAASRLSQSGSEPYLASCTLLRKR